ncbi:hypothetical protein CLOBOL_04208 [Enterocloster bolteae ATCC BAA-613]|uniref:Uncharacterized protein n=1 Tax=Enterocloster bolteae (strain ATCC BAA-613 / DSM 15670 / CCUG 46953 / JCM 12243 / WAL 16351) TaxID=411902 RepID=A8RV43_ENTBW|nr:hypothetical protein CLOBOL_04208 [Enterocloster bolteae ATCC BAA-613]
MTIHINNDHVLCRQILIRHTRWFNRGKTSLNFFL